MFATNNPNILRAVTVVSLIAIGLFCRRSSRNTAEPFDNSSFSTPSESIGRPVPKNTKEAINIFCQNLSESEKAVFTELLDSWVYMQYPPVNDTNLTYASTESKKDILEIYKFFNQADSDVDIESLTKKLTDQFCQNVPDEQRELLSNLTNPPSQNFLLLAAYLNIVDTTAKQRGDLLKILSKSRTQDSKEHFEDLAKDLRSLFETDYDSPNLVNSERGWSYLIASFKDIQQHQGELYAGVSNAQAISSTISILGNWHEGFKQSASTCAPISMLTEYCEHYPFLILRYLNEIYISGGIDISGKFHEIPKGAEIIAPATYHYWQRQLEATFANAADPNKKYNLDKDQSTNQDNTTSSGPNIDGIEMIKLLTDTTGLDYDIITINSKSELRKLNVVGRKLPVLISLQGNGEVLHDISFCYYDKSSDRVFVRNKGGLFHVRGEVGQPVQNRIYQGRYERNGMESMTAQEFIRKHAYVTVPKMHVKNIKN